MGKEGTISVVFRRHPNVHRQTVFVQFIWRIPHFGPRKVRKHCVFAEEKTNHEIAFLWIYRQDRNRFGPNFSPRIHLPMDQSFEARQIAKCQWGVSRKELNDPKYILTLWRHCIICIICVRFINGRPFWKTVAACSLKACTNMCM